MWATPVRGLGSRYAAPVADDGDAPRKKAAWGWWLVGGGVLFGGGCLILCVGPSIFGFAMAGLPFGSSSSSYAPTPMPVATYDAAALVGGPVLPDPTGPILPVGGDPF